MIRTTLRSAVAVAFLAGFALAAAVAAAAPANPLSELAGAWRGAGTLTPLGGSGERVNCRVTYEISGARVVQMIDCAGTSYRIQAVGTLTYAQGKLTGTWAEKNYGTRGGAYGSVTGNTVYVRISSDDFNARMHIDFSPAHHSLRISQFDPGNGKYHNIANIELRR